MASAHRGQATFPSDPGPILSSLKTTASGHSQIILLIEHEKESSGGHRYSQTTPLASHIFLPSSLHLHLLSLHLFSSIHSLFFPLSSLPTVLSLLAVGSFISLFSHLLSPGASCFTFNSFSYFLRLLSFFTSCQNQGQKRGHNFS
jgi:hypothetical protein